MSVSELEPTCINPRLNRIRNRKWLRGRLGKPFIQFVGIHVGDHRVHEGDCGHECEIRQSRRFESHPLEFWVEGWVANQE